jgi:hypothetical protein
MKEKLLRVPSFIERVGPLPPLASFRIFVHQFCHRLPLIGFAESENGCTLTVPPNTVPNPVFIPIHDFERGDRALVPVLDLTQDSINVLGHEGLPETKAALSFGKLRQREELKPVCPHLVT